MDSKCLWDKDHVLHFSETPMVHNRVSWTWNLLNQYLMDKKKMELGRTGGNPIPVQGRQMGIAALGLGDHPQWPPDPPPQHQPAVWTRLSGSAIICHHRPKLSS